MKTHQLSRERLNQVVSDLSRDARRATDLSARSAPSELELLRRQIEVNAAWICDHLQALEVEKEVAQ